MRIRFSLLTLILLVTLISGPLVMVSGRLKQNRFEEDLAASLKGRYRGIVRVVSDEETFLRKTRIDSICLSAKGLSDEEFRSISRLMDLRSLRLSTTKVTDEGLRHLQGIDQLTELSLVGAPITDRGLAQIKQLKSLEKLNLSRTGISDDGISHLAQLRNLQTLNVRKTNLTDTGVELLQRQLPSCQITY